MVRKFSLLTFFPEGKGTARAAGIRDQLPLMIYCGVLLTGRDLGQGRFWGVSRPREPSQQFH